MSNFWAYRERAMEYYQFFKSIQSHDDFISWLDRLAVMGTIAEEDWHKEYGKHCRYPKCCINWFIFMAVSLNIERVGVMSNYLYGYSGEYNYVKCPTCRRTNVHRYS